MKKIIRLSMVVLGIITFSGCSQKDTANDTSSNSNSDKQVSKKSDQNTTDSAVSIDIISNGNYLVGKDIKPGSYYAVLADIEYGPDDAEEEGYVYVQANTEIDGKADYTAEMLYEVGDRYRFILKDGDQVSFEDNYSPASWKVKLLNESDFRTYMKKQ
ncbi:hypothetical protein JNUCC77_19100 (plasmid) [Enterococcus alishanensis]